MNYKALEAVDKRWGRLVTKDDWLQLGEKEAKYLTADDLTIIEVFSGPKAAADARARREKALSPALSDPAETPRRAPTMGAVVSVIKVALEQPNARLAEVERLKPLVLELCSEKTKLRDELTKAVIERVKSQTSVERLEQQLTERIRALETRAKL